MKFLDFFSGIGTIRIGMEQAGHECVGHVEWDKYAQASYMAMHDIKESEFIGWDIRGVRADKLPGANAWWFGAPCQDFSIAGKRAGLEGDRSSLVREVFRLVRETEEEDRPEWLLYENVKGMLSSNGGFDFLGIILEMDELGYDIEWQTLNSKDFGVPQNRERVFTIGHSRRFGRREILPIGGSNKENIRVQGHNTIANCITTRTGESNSTGSYVIESEQYAQKSGIPIREATSKGYAIAEPGDSINLEQPNSKTRRGRVGKGIANTLTTSCNQATVVEEARKIAERIRPNTEIGVTLLENGDIRPHRMDERKSGLSELNINYEGNQSSTITASHSPKIYGGSTRMRIRKLTPRECFRLQGIPDEYFDKARAVNSDSQLYKQAGNACTVNVIYEIAKRLEGTQ